MFICNIKSVKPVTYSLVLTNYTHGPRVAFLWVLTQPLLDPFSFR